MARDLPFPTEQRGPMVFFRSLPRPTTPVYETLWRFAAERQEIFFRRLSGAPPPWTEDPILARYRFTNAYRASDRTSQYLIRRVIYRSDLPMTINEVCFRVLLFKLFNKIETWEWLERALGPLTYEGFSFERYEQALSDALAAGRAIYSGAYIMPPGPRHGGHIRKHQHHLALLRQMMSDCLADRLTEATSMERAYRLLQAYPTIGPFLAYQLVTDLNYSEVVNFDEIEFTVAGPGARDGIRKCFGDVPNHTDIIKLVADRQEEEFARLGISFRSLWGRRLQLIDCQNLFCEVDKYARVSHPEHAGYSRRVRLKRRFAAGPRPVTAWYPPRWGLNDKVAEHYEAIGTGLEQHGGGQEARDELA